jgi:hypothetical protein
LLRLYENYVVSKWIPQEEHVRQHRAKIRNVRDPRNKTGFLPDTLTQTTVVVLSLKVRQEQHNLSKMRFWKDIFL